MRAIFLTLLCLLCAALPSNAQLLRGASTVQPPLPVACRVSGTASVDGCTGSPFLASAYSVSSGPGIYYFPSMLTASCAMNQVGCARQSGQTYYSDGAFNEAGKDYPVGLDVVALASLGLNPKTLRVPTSGNLPTGCTINSSGFIQVTCQSTSSNITLEGFNFTNIGLKCQSTMTGHLTVRNNYFTYGTNFILNGSFYGLALLSCGGPATFEDNVVDGNGPAFSLAVPSPTTTISFGDNGAGAGLTTTDCGAATNICIKYNAIMHCLGRCITDNSVVSGHSPSITLLYNFWQGDGYPSAKFNATIASAGTSIVINSVSGGAPGGNIVGGANLFANTANFTYGTSFSGACNVSSLPATCTLTASAGPFSNVDMSEQGVHLELVEYTNTTGTQDSQIFKYNTAISDNENYNGNAAYSPTESVGGSAVTITNFDASWNLLIANNSTNAAIPSLFLSPSATWGRGIGNGTGVTFVNYTNVGNVFDPTGLFACITAGYNVSLPPTITVNSNANLLCGPGNASCTVDSNINSYTNAGLCFGHF